MRNNNKATNDGTPNIATTPTVMILIGITILKFDAIDRENI